MEQITDLPEDVKRLLRNLEARSDNVVSDAIEELARLNNPDPRIILTLRKRASEKRGWLFRVKNYAVDGADKLSKQADEKAIHQLEDFLLNNEPSSRELLASLVYIQLENHRKLKELAKKVQWFLIWAFIMSFLIQQSIQH